MTHDEELLHIDQVIDRVDTRFPDLPQEGIERVVRSAHEHFATGKVRDFVPLLVERLAREKLQGLVPAEPVAPPKAGSEVIGAEMIARRWWSGWLAGCEAGTRTPECRSPRLPRRFPARIGHDRPTRITDPRGRVRR
ncbi:three-helix bundle dimerization domain-containing protein [Rhodococcus wratislaviensis]|uniref:Uncharacterized protein n=1 Tax=Rhodococcus wratislaviensis NBRC 100605 TaxID=1219028 RepID=X0PRH3_RHOWR|nr:hypothetical protein [Rhodococcus wratislaviensis]GAF45453.1 hypothetical protein RW1_022_00300 [Rhodococcus wratislaviensis NBRC 100605]